MAFTVVREPIATALAAYSEVAARRHAASKFWLKAREQSGAEEEGCLRPAHAANMRLHAFLDLVERGAPVSAEFFHFLPQAFKIRAGPQLAAIARLDALDSGMREVALLAGLPQGSLAAASVSYDRKRSSSPDAPCSRIDLEGDSVLQQRLCRLYAVDYACFTYALPTWCKDAVLRAEGYI